MTEHVHDYELLIVDSHKILAVCLEEDCDSAFGGKLDKSAILRRLNATNKLSADTANYAAEFTQAGTNKHSMDQESEGNVYYLTDALRAYAAALEENDKPS